MCIFLGIQSLKLYLTEEFTFQIVYPTLNLSSVARFTSLEHLWLLQKNRQNVDIVGCNNDVTPFQVRHLHLYTNNWCENLVALLPCFPRLETLDLKFNDNFFDVNCNPFVLWPSKINLRFMASREFPVTSVEYLSGLRVLDFHRFIHSFVKSCEYFDFSNNNFHYVTGNLFEAFPSLRLIDLSNNHFGFKQINQLDETFINPIFSWLAFHKHLEIVNLSNQVETRISTRRKRSFPIRKTPININLLFSDSQQGQEYRSNLTQLLFRE